MKKIIYILLLLPLIIFSQKQEKEKKEKEEVVKLAEKQVLRKGNDLYKQKRFTDAEAKYKKALQQNQTYQTAHYNLANTFYEQNKFKEALPGYDFVAKSTKDKATKAQSFHNMGNVFMKQKQYEKAISVYKNSLRINPKDDETRYNLALAQDLLKKQNKDKNKDNKDKKDKNKDKDKNSENKDKKDKDKDKKKDEGDNKDKDKDKKKGDDDKDKKDQNKKGDNEQKDKKQPKPQPNKLSKQQVEQLLEAMNNEENKTQKKVNAKKARGRKVKQEKDW